MVDGRVDQRDHPAEAGRQAARVQVVFQEGDELLRRECGVFVDTDLVGVKDPALREPHQ